MSADTETWQKMFDRCNQALALLALDNGMCRNDTSAVITEEIGRQAIQFSDEELETFVTGEEQEQFALIDKYRAAEFHGWLNQCLEGELFDVYFIEHDPPEEIRRERLAEILETIARDGLPGPRDLDVALDAIEFEYELTLEKAEALDTLQEMVDDDVFPYALCKSDTGKYFVACEVDFMELLAPTPAEAIRAYREKVYKK